MTTTLTPPTSASPTASTRAGAGAHWWSSSAGFVSLGAVLLVTAGAFAALFGFGHADHTVQFLRGNAWLTNDQTGSVVRVNGATGKPDFEMKFKGAAGDDLQVIQGPDGVFVLNRITGEVTKLDDAQLELGGSIKTDPNDQPLFVLGGGNAYLLARRTGHVQQVDPSSANLEAVGNAVELGHGVANALVDDGGRLVASTPETGELAFAIDGRKDAPVKVAEGGDTLTVSLVGDQLVAVDRTKGTVAPVDPAKGVLTVFSIEAPHDGELAVEDKMTGSRLWVVHVPSSELIGVDIHSGNQLHVPIKASGDQQLGAPLPNGKFVYVPDFAKGELVKVDTESAAIVERVAVTGGTKGKFESFVKDDRVWGNDQVGQLAVVIDRDGKSLPVEKYRPGLPSNDDVFDAPGPTSTTTPKSTPSPSTTSTTQPKTKSSIDPLPDPGVPGGSPNPDPVTTTSTPKTDSGKTPPAKTDPPPPAAGKPGTPAPLLATAGDTTVTLQWIGAVDNGSPLLKYVVTEPTMAPRDIAAKDTTTTITGLTNGTTYTFSVMAVNAIGDGPAATAAPVTPQALVPGAPENVVAVLVADPNDPAVQTAIKLTWDMPVTHPELVGDFQYECPEIGASMSFPAMMPANTPSFSVIIAGQSHLTTTGYTCWVQTIDTNSVARGRTDLPIAATLWPFGIPGQATNLNHGIIIPDDAKGTSNSVFLTWDAPTDAGGRPIDSYEVEIETPNSFGDFTHYTSRIAPGNATSLNFTGFPTGSYRFHIRARGGIDAQSGLQFFGAFSGYATIS
jgi:predicted RNA-binding protein with TRAM domain